MKFTVKCSTWARGSSDNTNFLYSKLTRNSCCLGFVCNQIGFSNVELDGITRPGALEWKTGHTDKGILIEEDNHRHTRLTEDAIAINDSITIEDEERKSLLSKLFKKHGHEMVFVD